MRTLIVDDEPAARRRLATMLAELDVEVVGEAADGVEALRLVAERAPTCCCSTSPCPRSTASMSCATSPSRGR